MKSGFRVFALFFAPLALLSAGCAQTPVPTSAPSPFIAQVGGEWSGSAKLVSVTGFQGSSGGCMASDIDARVRAASLSDERVTFSVTQSGKDLTAMQVRSTTTGLTCTHTGDASLTGVSASGQCETPKFQCANGTVEAPITVGSVVSGTVVNNTMSGTWTNSYNTAVGNVILTYQYTAQRQ